MEKEQYQVDDSNVDDSTASNEEQNYEQNDSTGENESTEGAQKSDHSGAETPDQRLARLKRQYERELKKQGKESGQESRKEGHESGKESSQKDSVDEKYLKLDLKTEGIKDTKEQDVVLTYIREAKLLGRDVDVATALQSPVVREDIEKIRKKNAVPKPSSRTNGGASNSIEYYAAQIKKGAMRLTDISDAETRKALTKMKIF